MSRSVVWILLVVITLRAFTAEAQDLDSLRTVWHTATLPDSARYKACYDLVWDGYLFSDPDSALILAEALHRQAQSKGSTKFEALSYDLKAAAWYVKGDMRKALSIYAVSLPMHERIGNYESAADVIGNMASMHSFLGEHEQALDLYDRALRMHTGQADTLGMANDINAIGRVHMVRGDHARAIEHYTRSLRMQHALGNDRGIATGLGNLGSVHMLQGDFAAARERHEQAIGIAERLGDKDQVAENLAELGTCHLELGDTASARSCFTRSLRLCQEVGDQRGVVMVTNKLADLHYGQQRHPEALALYRQAAAIAARNELPFGHATALIGAATTLLAEGRAREALIEVTRAAMVARDAEDISLERDAAELLYRAHRALGHMGEALIHHEHYLLLRDSMMREENQRESLRNQFAYDRERQQLADSLSRQTERIAHAGEIAAQRSRNHLLFAALLVVALLTIGIWSRLRYIAQANRTIKAAQAQVVEAERKHEAEAVRTRIARDIHDELGAELTKINLFGREADRLISEDPSGASMAVARMGELSRQVSTSLRDLVHTMDPAADKSSALVAHAREMCTRVLAESGVQHELDFRHMGAEQVIDASTKRDLLLLVKEAINNALKHAQARTVRVRFHTDERGFSVEVQDDGRGFDAETTATGHGLRNMHQRAAALGGAFTMRAAPDEGCHIAVTGQWPTAYYSRGIP